MTTEIELKRGLQGVYIDKTQSSFIDGAEGKLLYRGYSIHDLAEKSTFEETVYLLLYGKLPNQGSWTISMRFSARTAPSLPRLSRSSG